DGREGLRRAVGGNHDLVVLDVKVHGMNGFDICRELRVAKPVLPVIFLTSCSSEIDRVLGFELGADDYIEKPVSIHELVVRIRNKLRRRSAHSEGADYRSAGEVLNTGPFVIDPVRRSLHKSGRAVKLTTKEFDLIYFLARNPLTVFSKA